MMESFEVGPRVCELSVPEPGPNEVLVRVHGGSINPVDIAVTFGALKETYEHMFPITLGRDFAGVVEATGDAVARFAPGDDVFGFVQIADPAVRAGSFADYIVVAEDSAIARRPIDLGVPEAAVLGLSGTAALLSVEAVDPHPGDVVLVSGATGGVGRNALQLAAARGASIIATGLPGDAADLEELGASDVIDYTGDVAAAVRERHPDGIAGLVYLVHPPADFAAQAELVATGGRVATTVHAANVEALAASGITATNVFASADPALIERLADLAVSGVLTPRVERTYTLSDLPNRLGDIAAGHARGKLAVTIADRA
jgi:NADPH:quinone reductase-like Zn-dependent oxidoreductase